MSIDLKIKDPSEILVDHSKTALKNALDGDLKDWQSLLREHSEIDGLSLVFRCLDRQLKSLTHDGRDRPDLSWLVRMSRTAMSTRRGELSNAELVLSELWTNLQRKVTKLLQTRSRDLPEEGFALYFTEALTWCIVFSYKFSGNAAIARVVHYTKSPQSVYDIFALSHMSDEHTRTIIKKVVRSRSKVIIHRNVLIEVDRYIEERVFGPTIDTLYLHEFISRLLSKVDVMSSQDQILSAMEIGCGNGLLTAGLARKCSNLKTLVAVDTDVQAIQCTSRNVGYATQQVHGPSFYGVCGTFKGDLLNTKFDLVVSNPPYLPYRENDVEGDENSQRVAIKGTELIEEMVQNSPMYLSTNGALIIVYSELAEQELMRSIPDEMQFVSANKGAGFRVLFDLEDVVDNPNWLRFLESRGLEHDHSGSVLHHHLKIGFITHKRAKIEENHSIASTLLNL